MIMSGKRTLSRIAVGALCAIAGLTIVGAAGASAAGFAERNLRAPGPAVRSVEGTEKVGSFNWSGYAQTAPAGTFHAANDTWVVPTVTTGPGLQIASDWIGIGGFQDATLVQDGTTEANNNGTPEYFAWTEILPEPESPLALAIKPGDKVTATVAEVKPGVWKMTVADKTTKLSKSRLQAYGGSTHASVEAIHERPCFSPCSSVENLAELAPTNNVTFDPGKYGTGIKPEKPLLSLTPNGILYQIFMLNNADTAIIASPSVEDKDFDGFAVADGSVSPPPPKS